MLIVQKHNIDELKKYGFEEGFITNGRKDKPCLFLRDFMTCDMYILEDEITNVYERDALTFSRCTNLISA